MPQHPAGGIDDVAEPWVTRKRAAAPLERRTTVIRGGRYRFLSTFEAGVAPSLVTDRSGG